MSSCTCMYIQLATYTCSCQMSQIFWDHPTISCSVLDSFCNVPENTSFVSLLCNTLYKEVLDNFQRYILSTYYINCGFSHKYTASIIFNSVSHGQHLTNVNRSCCRWMQTQLIITEHKLPFLAADHFTNECKFMFPDSSLAEQHSCYRNYNGILING